MNWCNDSNWPWGGSILMTVGMVMFWALVIAAIVFAVQYLASSRRTGSSPGPGRAVRKACSHNAMHAVRSMTLNASGNQ